MSPSPSMNEYPIVVFPSIPEISILPIGSEIASPIDENEEII